MRFVKVRRVGNSNVISLPHELAELGYEAGSQVMVEALPDGDLRIVRADRVRELVRQTGRRVVAEDREAMRILEEHDKSGVRPRRKPVRA